MRVTFLCGYRWFQHECEVNDKLDPEAEKVLWVYFQIGASDQQKNSSALSGQRELFDQSGMTLKQPKMLGMNPSMNLGHSTIHGG